MTIFLRVTLLASAAALGLAAAAQAQNRVDLNAPISFSSDSFNRSASGCATVMTGNVELNQDRTRIRANTARVVNASAGGACRSRVERMEASGNVFYVTPDLTVRADAGTFNTANNEVVFTGNVIALQGQDVSTANRMVYNTESGAVVFSGNVRGVVYPDESGAAR